MKNIKGSLFDETTAVIQYQNEQISLSVPNLYELLHILSIHWHMIQKIEKDLALLTNVFYIVTEKINNEEKTLNHIHLFPVLTRRRYFTGQKIKY